MLNYFICKPKPTVERSQYSLGMVSKKNQILLAEKRLNFGREVEPGSIHYSGRLVVAILRERCIFHHMLWKDAQQEASRQSSPSHAVADRMDSAPPSGSASSPRGHLRKGRCD